MDYKELLPLLKQHQQVVVTGPHRAGTTIAAKILAHDLDYECGLEEGAGNSLCILNGNVTSRQKLGKPCVYQMPLLFAYCHTLPELTAIVCMRRRVEDVMASEKRIGWSNFEESWHKWKKRELSKYFATWKDPFNNSQVAELADTLKQQKGWDEWYKRPMAEVKYEIWTRWQKPKIKFAYELDYESLSVHPMWVSKDKRKNFHPRQTEVRR